MKITVVTPRFALSGVPLAQLRLAKALAATGHDVHFVVGFVNPGYTLPALPGIRVTVLDQPRVSRQLGALKRHLQTERPDVVFSAEDHLNAVVLLAARLVHSDAKISCSSRVTPFDTYSRVPFSKRWILKQFMRAMAPRADALTCVSRDMVDQYHQIFPSLKHVAVYNIVVEGRAKERMREPVDEPWLLEKRTPVVIAAGSLVPWKGFADLVGAFHEVRKTRNVRLLILGDGPLRATLEAQVHALGLNDVVKFVGYVANPLKYFRRADVFVLASYVEGLPNVLVEAMMCGCTPVSTNCPTGPREVLADGKYGYLVPMRDPLALATAIATALDHPVAKELLAEAVRPFAEEEVLRRHFEVLGVGRPRMDPASV